MVGACMTCHRRKSEVRGGNYVMAERALFIRGNEVGPDVVVPGDSAESLLVKNVTGLIEDVEMPPLPLRDRYDPLPDEEIGKLRRWIDDGLPGF